VVLAYETLKLRQAPEDGDAATHTKYRLMVRRVGVGVGVCTRCFFGVFGEKGWYVWDVML
jgi:hypothetical protein